MAREELIYSVWSADETPLAERAAQVLATVSKVFPKVTYWNAGHNEDRGLEDEFDVEIPYNEDVKLAKGFDATELWQQTIEHFAKLGLDDRLSVQLGSWSDELNTAVATYFDEYDFHLDNWDDEFEEERDMSQADVFVQLFKQLGSCSAIDGLWMLNHSAFAGNPACLYEPKQLFASYYKVLKYKQVTKTVQNVRNAVKATLSANQIAEMLERLGAKVEPLGGDRLFVQFGELGSDDSQLILQKLELLITAQLSRAGQLKQAA